MDERDIVEWLRDICAPPTRDDIADYIEELRQSLSTTQAELANSKERHRLTELDACNANSRANELQAQLDAAKDPRAHQGALVQYRDRCDAAKEALAALRARVVEVGGKVADIAVVGANVPDEAVIDVTYTHVNGPKYGIVQTRMKWFRALAALVAESGT